MSFYHNKVEFVSKSRKGIDQWYEKNWERFSAKKLTVSNLYTFKRNGLWYTASILRGDLFTRLGALTNEASLGREDLRRSILEHLGNLYIESEDLEVVSKIHEATAIARQISKEYYRANEDQVALPDQSKKYRDLDERLHLVQAMLLDPNLLEHARSARQLLAQLATDQLPPSAEKTKDKDNSTADSSDPLKEVDSVIGPAILESINKGAGELEALRGLVLSYEKLLDMVESDIRSEYEGTAMLESKLSKLDQERAALAAVKEATKLLSSTPLVGGLPSFI